MAKKKKDIIQLSDRQLKDLNAFHHSIELLKCNIIIKEKDITILKKDQRYAEQYMRLLSEQVENNGHTLKDLKTKLDNKLGDERTNILQRIAKELGLKKPFKGFAPDTGEIDF